MAKRLLLWGLTLTLPLVLLAVAIETYGALFHASRGMYRYEAKLGWAPKRNYVYEGTGLNSNGEEYSIVAATNEHGFRLWGNVNAKNKKILFLGDSYTGEPDMSDEHAYFSEVKRLTDLEVFAIGAGGYGTLQELMLLRDFDEIISPDILSLQFCDNDFVNNSFILEDHSIVRNQKNLRPYFKDGDIIYRQSVRHWYRFLYTYSRIFRLLDGLAQQYQYTRYDGYFVPPFRGVGGLVQKQTDQGLDPLTDENRNAEDLTIRLLKMMADVVSEETILLTFNCSTRRKTDQYRWLRVATAAGFQPLPGISQAIETAKKNGVPVYARDGAHWGPEGHRIVGMALADELNRILSDAHAD